MVRLLTRRDLISSLYAKTGEGPAGIGPGPSPAQRTTDRGTNYLPTDGRKRPVAGIFTAPQASAHTRQCSMSISLAWVSHSSPHSRHASAQARRAALIIAGSDSVCLETILPVVAHTSEQLRHIVMQRLIWETISSPRQASAQALHDCEQSKHASMHSTSASASITAGVPGWVSSISLA